MDTEIENIDSKESIVDVACLIHGNVYDWQYVEKLYRMVNRWSTSTIRFHVFTEPNREVPEHMIKHELDPWPGVSGPKKSWWYKMQMFNSEYHQGHFLYFDLDLVIIDDIQWIFKLDRKYFWTIKDFKYLWSPNFVGINSSIMSWDVSKFSWIWDTFKNQNLNEILKKYHGDQDFLSDHIDSSDLKFLDPESIKSWRWQIKDGGWDFHNRKYIRPNSGSNIEPGTSVVVFHGRPKPHEVLDSVIMNQWR